MITARDANALAALAHNRSQPPAIRRRWGLVASTLKRRVARSDMSETSDRSDPEPWIDPERQEGPKAW